MTRLAALTTVFILVFFKITAQNPCPPTVGMPFPPPVPVRTPAEWEPIEALMLSWRTSGLGTTDVLAEIVRQASRECRVLICCNDTAFAALAKQELTERGVDWAQQVDFLTSENNTVWIRDFGPTTVYEQETGNRRLVDWIYNRYPPFSITPRVRDDTMALDIARYVNLPLHSTTGDTFGMVNTGGNFMTDGMGRAFASKLVLDDNQKPGVFCTEKSEAEVDETFERYMGIHEFIRFDRLPFDTIDHIDMHYKLLDESTLMIGQYPENTSNGPYLNANIEQVFGQLKTPFGKPYNIVRIPVPPDLNGEYPAAESDSFRTYTNAVFVDKSILVPTYNSPTDSIALDIWRRAMPGYKVKGIFSGPLITRNGALHCVTKEVFEDSPLLIQFGRLPACISVEGQTEIPIEAIVKHRSGIQSAGLYYRLENQSDWLFAPMSAGADIWTAALPVFPEGTKLQYYIEAKAQDGKIRRRPLPAPDAWFETAFCKPSGTYSPENGFVVSYLTPNPADAYSWLTFETPGVDRVVVDVVSLDGTDAFSVFDAEVVGGSHQIRLDARSLPAGAYTVRVRSARGVQSIRWIVL